MITDYTAWAAVRDTIAAKLRATSPNLDVLVDGIDVNGEPTYRNDKDGRAHITCVLWMGVGAPVDGDDTLDGTRQRGTLSWQITAVGGDTDRAVRAAMYARQAITDQYITADGGRAREQFDTVTVREDTSAKPSRFYIPLAYTTQLA